MFSLLLSLLLLISSAHAFNITKILSQYPDFSTFNDDLTKTQLVDQINSRQTITVLAVDNSAMSAVSGQTTDTLKMTLSVHVILDYYDVQKLQKLQNKSLILTTLLQSSGQAKGQQGFLNVTNLNTGGVSFGSAVPGSQLGSSLVKSIASQPYNISVLQVTNVIIPSGTGSSSNSSSNSAPPTPSQTPAGAPTQSPTGKAPAPSVAKTPAAAPPKSGKAPSPSANASTPTTSPSPTATPPSAADAPASSSADAPSVADSPVGSTPPGPANVPAGNDPVADGPAGGTSDTPSRAPASTFGDDQLGVLVVILYATCSVLGYMM